VGKLACLLRAQSAAAAGCEARSAEHPVDGNTRRVQARMMFGAHSVPVIFA